MHHICNFVRFCFNNNKNTTLKSTKTFKKFKKNIKTCFLNFNKNIKKRFYIYLLFVSPLVGWFVRLFVNIRPLT